MGIFGQQYQVNAEIASLQSMSAHGDQADLIQFLNGQDKTELKKIFLVHGEFDTQNNFRTELNKRGYENVEIPKRHQRIELI